VSSVVKAFDFRARPPNSTARLRRIIKVTIFNAHT